MLSLHVMNINGLKLLHGIFKYRAPAPHNLAMYYVAIVWLPFQKFYFQINIEAMESETTGMREATVMMLEKDKFLSAKEQTPIVLKSGAELLERLKSTSIMLLPSDDEQYDHMFPEHPLSKVRKRLDEVIKTLKLEAQETIPKPFRVQHGWKFWK